MSTLKVNNITDLQGGTPSIPGIATGSGGGIWTAGSSNEIYPLDSTVDVYIGGTTSSSPIGLTSTGSGTFSSSLTGDIIVATTKFDLESLPELPE